MTNACRFFPMGLIFAAIACVANGCYLSSNRAGVVYEQVPDMAIVPSESIDKENTRPEELELPFSKNQDGTRLVLDFLQLARQRGAIQVSDLRISFALQNESVPMTCETWVQPVSIPTTIQTQRLRPGTGTTKPVYALKPVTRYVTEYQYQCRSVSKPVTRTETYYSTEYDYAAKMNRSVPRTRGVTHYEYQNECRSEPVSRMVTRYEYQLETQYVPPQWDYVAQTYSKWSLVETAPSCEKLNPETLPPGYVGRIEGLIHIPMKQEK